MGGLTRHRAKGSLNQPHLLLTLVCSDSTKEVRKWQEARKGGRGARSRMNNRGEAGFVIPGLNNMVAGWSWSKRTSSDWLGDPTFSPKVRFGQQDLSPLRSLGLWIRTRPSH